MNESRILSGWRRGSVSSGSRAGLVLSVIACGVFLAGWPTVAQDPGEQPPAAAGNEQVLTRGPVHEAFAAPVVHDPKPGPVVAKEPPAPVEELPPDQKPSGQNVQWIPGYWSWDQERNDYLWISGVWREPPPGRQWVPGYWHQVQGGFQWVAGDWAPVDQNGGGAPAQGQPSSQAAYLPPPPPSLETGPNSPAPSAGVFWSPGSWYWQENRYVWRPGFWAAAQPSWVWVPPHYVCTPGGFLFVEGYWDLPLANRGLLFAPVYYPQPVYLRPAYVFTPSITIATPGLVANLFVQPGYGQYVFGDYYDRSFLAVGIFPWFSFSYISGPSRPVFYDPVFSFYASINVTRDPGWVTRIQREYIVRRENVAMRPPRTFVEQTRIIERTGGGRDLAMARPIHELARDPKAAGGMRLERLSAESQRRWQERGAQLAQFRSQRTQLERQAGAERRAAISQGRSAALAAHPRSLALPSSPVSAPIHHHLTSGQPVGPSGHTEHQTARQSQAEHTGPRYEEWGLESSSQRQAGAPMIHHDVESADRTLRLGQAAPHDVGRTPMVRSQAPMVGHDSATRSDQPRLHAPPQYTHRQPPPAPRPAPRNESKER